MNEKNQNLLRLSANKLIQSIGQDPARIGSIIPLIDSLIIQVQSSLLPNEVYSTYGIQGESAEITNDEKRRIAMRMNGFDVKDNRVWAEIAKRFGVNVKQGELTNIAQVIAKHAGIKLDRDAKRRKCVLLKWFDENWEKIYPFLDYVVLASSSEDETGQPQPQISTPAPQPPQVFPTILPPTPQAK